MATLGSSARGAAQALTEVVRCEVRLAKAEMKDASGKLGHRALRVAAFGILALLGVPPFLAFLVLGLGSLLGGIYWLSALIVSLVLFAVGGTLAYRGFSKLREEQEFLPETRSTLAEMTEMTHRRSA